MNSIYFNKGRRIVLENINNEKTESYLFNGEPFEKDAFDLVMNKDCKYFVITKISPNCNGIKRKKEPLLCQRKGILKFSDKLKSDEFLIRAFKTANEALALVELIDYADNRLCLKE